MNNSTAMFLAELAEYGIVLFSLLAIAVNGWSVKQAVLDARAVHILSLNGSRRITAHSWLVGSAQRLFGSFVSLAIGIVQVINPAPTAPTWVYYVFHTLNLIDAIILFGTGAYLIWARKQQIAYLNARTRYSGQEQGRG